ncbi:Phosphate ABC transporter, permease protein PstA [Candidatus Terasakiella magnetica]|uniref:Phosphate transport system permease protein PstA n=1 Tax=Candidatus Terasakiella magnetica TaxID=1867952 RepID=A0A1C3RCE6_9PROT|nr:phosphate ABC transporter permease PstA [Candidatus Terasakiella magnetica]SCA54892.1 Phosphate ABC transporter, permease protein PstA [Candidatus Terasakiella magnetica]
MTELKVSMQKAHGRLKKRHAAETRFKMMGIGALAFAFLCVLMLFSSIISNGYTGFHQTYMKIDVMLDEAIIDPEGSRKAETLQFANYAGVVKQSLRAKFPEVKKRRDKRKLYGLVSSSAGYNLRDMVVANPSLIGTTQSVWVMASDEVDMLIKDVFDRTQDESTRPITDKEIAWVEVYEKEGAVEKRFNTNFFAAGDSREPEQAGIRGALVGSALTMLVTLALSFPLGVMAAIYLEEFAPKNKFTYLVEVNINNLAAVPSIVFGLLGLAIFLNVFGMPRSAPVAGGVVLALMTLPTIIIASRAALKSIPPSIMEAAIGVGASKMQAVFHHQLPLALPGILTGTIIGMAQALGETAPLLMIGMVAFIADVPGTPFDPATVLPVQVYLWADSPERAFVEKTSAAIMVLLAFLITMNALAVLLRKKLERRW